MVGTHADEGLLRAQEEAKENDATKDMLLEDINKRDADNLELVYRQCRRFFFDNPGKAGAFMGVTAAKALKKLNVDLEASTWRALSPLWRHESPVANIDKQLLLAGVRVERRRYEDPQDTVRSGIYIYKANEIAYFISEPFGVKTLKKPEESQGENVVDLRAPHRKEWDALMVVTNYKE